jgi:hypothetical protein
LKFSNDASDYQNIPEKVGFGILRPFNAQPGNWVLIINDLGDMHYYYWKITPKIEPGDQSLTAHIELKSDDSSKKGFYLLFPPGDGVITIKNISMSVAGAAGN